MKLYKEIASVVRWNPTKTEYEAQKMEHLDKFNNLLPSGSGIDNGCKIDDVKSNESKIIIHSAFHHLDGNGFYVGWSNFTVTITPDFVSDFTLKITGNNAIYPRFSEVKEYLYDVFNDALNQPVK